MNQSTLSIRIDSKDKKNFETFCKKTGINATTAINMYIKAVLREQRIPFEIVAETFEEEVNRKLLEAEKDFDTAKRYTFEEVAEGIKKILK